MSLVSEMKGNAFGTHRVISPTGVLPQPAAKLDNDFSKIYDNEIVVNVDVLNVDSASFTQIKQACGGDIEKIKQMILGIVADKGKMQNPVTGSGGMFIGRVDRIGSALQTKIKPGDKIASLVSLSLTPLKIERIIEVRPHIDQVQIEGKAVLFESGIYAKIPKNMPENLVLSALDVAGAAAQAKRLVKKGQTVAIIGAGGKSGLLCAYEARKKAGKIIGIEYSDKGVQLLKDTGFCDEVLKLDATNAVSCYEEISKVTDGKLADIVINCVNVPSTEMASILMCRQKGTIYFFSMSTSFTKAALGAEGVGKDVNMIIGNGFVENHVKTTLAVLKKSPVIRKIYEETYA